MEDGGIHDAESDNASIFREVEGMEGGSRVIGSEGTIGLALIHPALPTVESLVAECGQ